MKTRLTWLLILMLALSAFWGCSDDDDDPITPSQTAFEVMAAAGADYINDDLDCPGVMSAADLQANLDLYTVIDIRSESAYLDGHIPGAIHSSLGTLIADLSANNISTTDNIVVACYTGQSAGHAKIALELLGYENVKSLLFGMSSWNSTLDSWSSNCETLLGTNAETTANTATTTYDFPTLSENVDSVVADRVAAMLSAGFKGIDYETQVMGNESNYFIINYFGASDYMPGGSNGVPGHIEGAFQYTPYASLGIEQMLEYLPTDMPIVVYCWTGQHSSQVTAYLNMLGYDAYSLKFGSNNLFYDQLTAHKWGAGAMNDFDLEVGNAPSATFETIANAMLDYVNDSTDCPGVIPAATLQENLALYKVVDIRSLDAYNQGHIEGAIHSGLGTLVADLEAANITTSDNIVVACYTGQSAGHAKIALELLGYENVKSLLFGMSSWNSSLDSWTSNCETLLGTNAETDGNNDLLEWHNYPTLDGESVESRVNTMLAGGFKGIDYETQVEGNENNYFIVNYFAESDYLPGGANGVPGHILGSYQFTPYASMGIDEMLGNIPTDMPVVVYCWTGQHSSQITAYLNMLGYDAYSLKFGSNNLFYDQLTAHKWGAGAMNDFPLEATPAVAMN